MATMAKDTYIPRIIDRKIDQYLNLFGAVEISGTIMVWKDLVRACPCK